MLKLGIVSEYNPFHYGHEYQIRYAKDRLHADQVIVIMSGNFTQRGLPAICDKRLRAAAAIDAGADVVLEMPPVVATADTPMFAQGAIDILLAYGCNAILFGSENDDIELLKKIAGFMATEEYWDEFEGLKKNNYTPDEARKKLCSKYMEKKELDYSFVNRPNNLLGIYYISAIIRRNSSVEIYTNKRMGQGYFVDQVESGEKYASATAIRNMIYDQRKCIDRKQLDKYMPSKMVEGIIEADRENRLVYTEDFYPLYIESLKKIGEDGWKRFCPMIPGEAIKKLLSDNSDFYKIKALFLEYLSELKADRIFNWILLGSEQKSIPEFMSSDHVGWQVLDSLDSGAKKEEKTEEKQCSDYLRQEWSRVDEVYRMVIER